VRHGISDKSVVYTAISTRRRMAVENSEAFCAGWISILVYFLYEDILWDGGQRSGSHSDAIAYNCMARKVG
jgi:hypothetical protein